METRPKALVIDESEHVLTYLSVCLDRMNFDIYPIQHGINALNLIEVFNPDIFFVNVDMPHISGFEMLRHIRAHGEFLGTPVIMMSANRDHARDCLSRGADFFLQKPVAIDQLHKAATLCYQQRKVPRKNLRAPINRPVTLFFGDKYYTCQAITLSEGGIYIRRVSPLPVGTEVEIELDDIAGESIRLRGEVLYVRGINGKRFSIPPGMAIQFANISSVEAEKVRAMVVELLAGDIVNEQIEPVLSVQ